MIASGIDSQSIENLILSLLDHQSLIYLDLAGEYGVRGIDRIFFFFFFFLLNVLYRIQG